MKTINDSVRVVAAEMLNTSMQDITAERIHGWATRLGATCKESLQVGNAAKMREALLKILGIADHLQTRYALPKLIAKEILELKQIAEAALSAPARNCDKFKKKEEAALAYAGECDAFIPQSILWQIGEWLDWLFAEAKGE